MKLVKWRELKKKNVLHYIDFVQLFEHFWPKNKKCKWYKFKKKQCKKVQTKQY